MGLVLLTKRMQNYCSRVKKQQECIQKVFSLLENVEKRIDIHQIMKK